MWLMTFCGDGYCQNIFDYDHTYSGPLNSRAKRRVQKYQQQQQQQHFIHISITAFVKLIE